VKVTRTAREDGQGPLQVAGAEPLLGLRVPTRAQLEALRTIADALREADHAVHQPSPASRG
jgi:hypothetical protein